MDQHLALLGHEVRDRVTGSMGVVTSLSFDLYGCVQAIVTPPSKKDGTQPDAHWYDVKRLEVRSKKPVMPIPDFESTTYREPGGAEKSLPPNQ